MKYNRMTVWSGGSETAKDAKINALLAFAGFVLGVFFHVFMFVCNLNDDKTPMSLAEHIFVGLFFLTLVGWITLLMFYSFKEELKNIKGNKLVDLYLYKINDFSKLGGIPEDKFILFSNESGVVLADKKNEIESRAFSFGIKYFYQFEDYCNKKAVSKEEVSINDVSL